MFRYFHGSRTTLSRTLTNGRGTRYEGDVGWRPRAVVSRVRDVRRVNSPESDMRPIMPGRSKLMAAMAASPRKETEEYRKSRRRQTEKGMFLSALSSRAAAAAQAGDLDGVSRAAHEAAGAPYPVERARAIRVVALSSLQSLSGNQDPVAAEEIMSRFAADGFLFLLSQDDLGMVLDVMARLMITAHDNATAFRIEFLSRIFETKLRRGTYTRLGRLAGEAESGSSGLVMALGMFHRALVVGKKPNAAMFNTLLESCFSAGDGARARDVLAEMARENVSINGTTLDILLRHTRDMSNVDAVFSLLRGLVSDGKLVASPGMSLDFVKAYTRNSSGSQASGAGEDMSLMHRHVRVERCFAVIDWFYESGVGVSRSTLDYLVCQFGKEGNAEGALHAWREMRRGWFGIPSRRGRRRLVHAVSQSSIPSRVQDLIMPKFLPHAGLKEARQLRRAVVASSKIYDSVILSEADDVSDIDQARDKAAVLHRWVRSGGSVRACSWLTQQIRTCGSVDHRVLLALFGRSRRSSDGPRGHSGVKSANQDAYKYALRELSSGRTVRGTHRERVVRRVTDALWELVQTSDEPFPLLNYAGRLARRSSGNEGHLSHVLEGGSAGRIPDRRALHELVSAIVRLAPVCPSVRE